MKFATFDADGHLTGFPAEAPSGDEALSTYQITDAQWQAHLDRARLLSLDDDGNVVETDPRKTPAERLAAWRANARVSRTQFCLACKRAGILTPPDAIAAARGEWPAAFAAALAGLPVDIDEAQIVWAAVSDVYRNDPVLEAMRQHLTMTHDAVDALFGGAPA